MSNYELIKTKEYDGTLKSFEELVNNLRIRNAMQLYNFETGEVILSTGLTLFPGDHYQFIVNEEFEAIGLKNEEKNT